MSFSPIEIEDSVESFEQGMNAGIEPILLPKNQLASARNGTLRGLFLLPRPPYRKITFNYGGDGALQSRVETGLWQGGCYYKPDIGAESLLASISGRLYQFVVVGSVATVFDQTGNNAQSSTATICWLWQTEKWVVWNDGISLPVFFDGAVTRRSLGAAASLGTTTAQVNIPAVGSAVALTMSQAYTGPINVPVRIDGLLYQVTDSIVAANQYTVTLKNLSATAGGTEAAGSSLITKPATIGYVTASVPVFTLGVNQTADKTISVTDTTNAPTAGTAVKFGTANGILLSTTGTTITARFSGPLFSGGTTTFNITSGSVVTTPSNTQPNVTLGTTQSSFAVPAIGSTVSVSLTTAYAGASTAIVYIGTDQFQLTASNSGSTGTGTTLNVILLSSANGKTTIASGTTVTSLAELPIGRMAEYGLGRNWMALNDGRSYLAGDIVGGPSGTLAYNYRDAVLKVTENSYLAGGGVFTVPGAGDIRSMRFPAQLDTSIGQGPLQVGTARNIFSCNAPVDRSTWQSVTNPLQTLSLIGFGPVGQDSTIIWNSDMIFRSRDGIRSLILAKRDFHTWGNTPISNEIRQLLAADDKSLLPFASAMVFDNRMLMTLAPTNSGQGVYFSRLAVINGDPISSLRGKGQSIYDGFWDGLNVLKLITGTFNEVDRGFAFHFNTTSQTIELWELLPTGADHFDNGTTKIVQEYELPVMRFQARGRDPHQLIRLLDGELYADSIDGATLFEVFFKPDYDTNYHPWYSWTVDPAKQANRQPRMGLGEPPSDSDASTQRPNREGYYFQAKVRVTGYARIKGMRCKAVTIPEQKYAPQLPITP